MTRDFIHAVAPTLHRAHSLRWLPPAMSQTYSRNQLLNALPSGEFECLIPHLEPVTLAAGQVLYEPNQAIEFAYFPTTAVIAHLNLMQTGRSVEAFSIGNEGMIGIPLILGTNQMPLRAVVQVGGDALRVSAKELRNTRSQLLFQYVQTLMNQIAQNLACTGLHSSQERCCYLLLLTQDRVGDPVLPLTHDLLARMVGVRRDRIGEIIATLERSQLVQHQRGQLTILNRSSLESAACECYQILRTQFDSGSH